VLERFEGVLDPERHIDGAISFTGELPVKGIGMNAHTGGTITGTTRETGAASSENKTGWVVGDTHGANAIMIEQDSGMFPNVRVDMDGTPQITLRDMIESRMLDGLVRHFAKMVEDDPINGEEAVERALYNLTVDFDANCHVMYRKVHELSAMHTRPTDGASINDVSGHFELNTRFATVVPRSELGGQLVTIAMVKPLETIEAQPDPAQTETWDVVNVVHDELALDEVLLTRADLESGVAVEDEDQSAFWVAHNGLKHRYETQGPNAQQIAATEMQSAMWTYEVPTSVTPENVYYPAEGVTMYPFFAWNGAHAEYTIDQRAAISTSLAKGPTPVERIQLFHNDPTLLSDDE